MKLIALMGKAGSGKDSILHGLLEQYPDKFNGIISCTSRPPRGGEKDGIDYHFCTRENFLEKMSKGDMLECTFFNGWYYGTSYSELSKEKINVGVFNPTGVRKILNTGIDMTIFYVLTSDKERLLRQLNRENNPDVKEIIRRFSTDEEDFKNLKDIPYINISNEKPYELAYNVGKIALEAY